MEIETIQINGSNLDKGKLLELIKSGRKPEAVKFIKATTRLGTKQSRDIVENLAHNPNFYEDDVINFQQKTEARIKTGANPVRASRPSNTGAHVIHEGKSPLRRIIIIAVAAIVTILLWLIISR